MRLFPAAARAMGEPGALWIVWPKKASGVASDLDGNAVREFGLAASLVDYKIAAIDAVGPACASPAARRGPERPAARRDGRRSPGPPRPSGGAGSRRIRLPPRRCVSATASRNGRPFAKDPCPSSGRRALPDVLLMAPSTASPWPPLLGGGHCGDSRDLADVEEGRRALPAQEPEANGLCAAGAARALLKVDSSTRREGNGPRDAIRHAGLGGGLRFMGDPRTLFSGRRRPDLGPGHRRGGLPLRQPPAARPRHGDRSMTPQMVAAVGAHLVRPGPRRQDAARRRADPGARAAVGPTDLEAARSRRRGDTPVMFYAGGYNRRAGADWRGHASRDGAPLDLVRRADPCATAGPPSGSFRVVPPRRCSWTTTAGRT